MLKRKSLCLIKITSVDCWRTSTLTCNKCETGKVVADPSRYRGCCCWEVVVVGWKLLPLFRWQLVASCSEPRLWWKNRRLNGQNMRCCEERLKFAYVSVRYIMCPCAYLWPTSVAVAVAGTASAANAANAAAADRKCKRKYFLTLWAAYSKQTRKCCCWQSRALHSCA